MTIICLEGPSAVGKTTVCETLSEQFGWTTIPEVNLLFERPQDPGKYWYYERQIERWEMAVEARKHSNVVLDGDVFQPIWYKKLFQDVDENSYSETCQFFVKAYESGEIGIPDHYFRLVVNEKELRERKEGDETRNRSNFEKHLGLIAPLEHYFYSLEEFIPMATIENESCLETSRIIHKTAVKLKSSKSSVSLDESIIMAAALIVPSVYSHL